MKSFAHAKRIQLLRLLNPKTAVIMNSVQALFLVPLRRSASGYDEVRAFPGLAADAAVGHHQRADRLGLA
jgi:hypothetical protein